MIRYDYGVLAVMELDGAKNSRRIHHNWRCVIEYQYTAAFTLLTIALPSGFVDVYFTR